MIDLNLIKIQSLEVYRTLFRMERFNNTQIYLCASLAKHDDMCADISIYRSQLWMSDIHARMYEDNERLDSHGNPSNFMESAGVPIKSVLVTAPIKNYVC